MSGISTADILGVTRSVTKKWTKQRKAEERGSSSRLFREYMYSDRVNCTDVVDDILPGAYNHASGGGQYSVAKRQLYYACREAFRKATDRPLKYNYFSTVLTKYLNQNPAETAGWKITADPRGTLLIPNAGHEVRIPCGTRNSQSPVSPEESSAYLAGSRSASGWLTCTLRTCAA